MQKVCCFSYPLNMIAFKMQTGAVIYDSSADFKIFTLSTTEKNSPNPENVFRSTVMSPWGLLTLAGYHVATKAALLLLSWLGEQKYNEKFMGQDKVRERSLTKYHHGQNRLTLGTN